MRGLNADTVRKQDLEHWVRIYNDTILQLSKQFPMTLPPACQLQLIPLECIDANHYNPNKMAPPESHLLQHSIKKNGFTMPIILNRVKGRERYTLVDGFHRFSLLNTSPDLQALPGYIPALILDLPEEKCISTSVRHNVARGAHQVELTANLTIKLREMGWSNEKIGKELGMEPDEVLRMQQITGLASAFRDQDFSQAWR
ncbi:ParB N-terminal domain-containing protein [Vibrio sp. 16]|uniref:IbrB-like domain-containing protein n=1 Tax=Vibrio sp. 16 TaxID=391586 RepID=UPI0005C52AAC